MKRSPALLLLCCWTIMLGSGCFRYGYSEQDPDAPPGLTDAAIDAPPAADAQPADAPSLDLTSPDHTLLADAPGLDLAATDSLPWPDAAAPDQGPPAGSHVWSKRFGSAVVDVARAVALDSSGNIYITGYSFGPVDFGGGAVGSGTSGWIAKLSPAGKHLWSTRLGKTGVTYGYGIAVDSGNNIIVVGQVSGAADFGGGATSSLGGYDAFVVKYAPTGAYLWAKRLGGSSADQALGVTTDLAGNVTMVGAYQSTAASLGGAAIHSCSGGHDGFITSFSPSGVHGWTRTFGDTKRDMATAVTADSSGNVTAVGLFSLTANFGGGTLKGVGASFDIFAASYTKSGGYLWAAQPGTSANYFFGGAAADSLGNVALTGIYLGSSYTAKGAPRWKKTFGLNGNGAAVGPKGAVYFTGRFSGSTDFGGGPITNNGSTDAFIAAYDFNGGYRWARGFGSLGADYGTGVAVDSQGFVTVVGHFEGNIICGGGALKSLGGYDIFVARYTR